MHISPERIRQARLKAGFTQDELARSIKTSARNIVRWESKTNGHQPRAEFVAAIAEATGQEVGYFFSSDSEEEEEEVADLDAELLAAFRRWRNGTRPTGSEVAL